jgi:PBP1b-binding outer membrane lipoprotein LpoB
MRIVLIVAMALLLCGCFNEETTGSVNACAANLHANYNVRDLRQCVDVCVKCARGVTATCTTSCTLKGAR